MRFRQIYVKISEVSPNIRDNSCQKCVTISVTLRSILLSFCQIFLTITKIAVIFHKYLALYHKYLAIPQIFGGPSIGSHRTWTVIIVS